MSGVTPQVATAPARAEASAGKVYLVTDCGSTTTKAVLITSRGNRYRLTARAEVPTTVEVPRADVMAGVLGAVGEVAVAAGRKLLTADGAHLIIPAQEQVGVDLYLSTSSAGGGLRMLVMGAVRGMSAASAERTALGAGAIVTDVLAFGDDLSLAERITLLRERRPDMILLSGGTNGGGTGQVIGLAEQIAAAAPRPRYGEDRLLPVIYAGNREARGKVAAALGDRVELIVVDNLRPTLEEENLGPARRQIHAVFLSHVMANAPGYGGLSDMCGVPVMPTPAACGAMVRRLAAERGGDVLAVDVGGATTDVFSVRQGVLSRTVSANLGLSYSIGNVCQEAGATRLRRWLPWEMPVAELNDRIMNKMIRPTTVPHSVTDLVLEHAAAREAVRLACAQHQAASQELKGVRRLRSLGETFAEGDPGITADLRRVDIIVGSGGVLAKAPRRRQAALVLIDAVQPLGVTELVLDAASVLPHLGVLATVDAGAAFDVLENDCLLPLGVCVAPAGRRRRPGRLLVRCCLVGAAGDEAVDLCAGELRCLELAPGAQAHLSLAPVRGVDVGAGPGRPLQRVVHGGDVGVVLDGRGRPLVWPGDPADRRRLVRQWHDALDLYPEVRS